jgi:hypothetical protein
MFAQPTYRPNFSLSPEPTYSYLQLPQDVPPPVLPLDSLSAAPTDNKSLRFASENENLCGDNNTRVKMPKKAFKPLLYLKM